MDNKPTEIVHANYAMRGIFVPTGSHDIVPMKSFFQYQPRPQRVLPQPPHVAGRPRREQVGPLTRIWRRPGLDTTAPKSNTAASANPF
jgi:hypothetical protein